MARGMSYSIFLSDIFCLQIAQSGVLDKCFRIAKSLQRFSFFSRLLFSAPTHLRSRLRKGIRMF